MEYTSFEDLRNLLGYEGNKQQFGGSYSAKEIGRHRSHTTAKPSISY